MASVKDPMQDDMAERYDAAKWSRKKGGPDDEKGKDPYLNPLSKGEAPRRTASKDRKNEKRAVNTE
jgi:hypothetical protein